MSSNFSKGTSVNPANPQLTKTCSSCGLQKPLSAFLQLAGLQGALYGSICSSCRKSDKDKKSVEPNESTTSTSGVKIDSKAKIQMDIDKRKHRQAVEERYHEDKEKSDKRQSQQALKVEKVITDEKKHRQDFLKKSSFLDNLSKKKQDMTDTSSLEIKEVQKKQIDISGSDTQIPQTKHNSAEFNKVKAWFGSGSPIVQQAMRALQHMKQKENTDNKSRENIEKPMEPPSGPQSKRK